MENMDYKPCNKNVQKLISVLRKMGIGVGETDRVVNIEQAAIDTDNKYRNMSPSERDIFISRDKLQDEVNSMIADFNKKLPDGYGCSASDNSELPFLERMDSYNKGISISLIIVNDASKRLTK